MCSSPISFSANCAEWKGTQYEQWMAVAAPNATKALSRAESAVSLNTQFKVVQYCSSTGSGMSAMKPGTSPKSCSTCSRSCCLAIGHLLSFSFPGKKIPTQQISKNISHKLRNLSLELVGGCLYSVDFRELEFSET